MPLSLTVRCRLSVTALALGGVLAGLPGAAAQVPLVDAELRSMSVGSHTAFTTEVEGATEKLAQDAFKDLMKEYGGRAKRSKPERFVVEAVTITSIGGSDPVNVYADFAERGSRTKTYVWFETRGDFLGEASARRDLDAAGDLLTEYANRLRRAAVEAELAAEEKELQAVERKLDKLERDHGGYERDIERARDAIERAQEAIVRAEENIARNLDEQEETRGAIERQFEDVEAVREKLQEVGREPRLARKGLDADADREATRPEGG